MAYRFTFAGLARLGFPVLFGVALAVSASRADESFDLPSYLRFSGYGTLGLATSDTNRYALPRDQEDATGISSATSPLWSDSRLGLQMDAEITPELSATIQGVFEKSPSISFTNTVQWAFLKYEPASWLQIRVGRMGADSFMLSDMRNVGFVYPWVRPPVEFYGLFPIYSYDGADATYRARLTEDWSLELEGFYGLSRLALYNDGTQPSDLKFPVFRGGNAILRDANWTFRLSGVDGRIGNTIPAIGELTSALNGLAPLIPQAGAAAAAINLKAEVHFYSAGFGYDDGVWTSQSEYGLTECDCQILRSSNAAYAMLGRHFGDWMPFLSFSKVWQSHQQISFSAPLPAPQIQQLFAAVNESLQSGGLDQDDLSVGLRWNFTDKADVKIQYDNEHVHNFSRIWRPLTDTPGPNRGIVNVFSASLDFIF